MTISATTPLSSVNLAAFSNTSSRNASTTEQTSKTTSANNTPESDASQTNNPTSQAISATDLKQTEKATQKAADEANKALSSEGKSLQFKVNSTDNQVIVNVIDTETKKVLQQIPSAAMLAGATTIVSEGLSAKGTLVSTNA